MYDQEDKILFTRLGKSNDNKPDVTQDIIEEINSIEIYKTNDLDKLIYKLDENIKLFEEIMNNSDLTSDNDYLELNQKSKEIDMSKVKNEPLNQILYGPPGTWKTYNVINKAIEIIGNKKLSNNDLEDRNALKEKFEQYKNDGQIEFVTFHQSYGYEEFFEGIKAIPPGRETNESDEMIYDVMDGVFKKIVNNAKDIILQKNDINFDPNNTNIFKMSLGGIKEPDVLAWCIENEYVSIGYGREMNFDSIKSDDLQEFKN